MTRTASILAAPALALLVVGPAHAQKKNPDAVPILLLSGGQREHHGYRDQASYLANLLEDRGKVRVTIVEDAAILETPAPAKYAVIVALADRRDPEFKLTESQQRALLDFVRSGGGYVSIHGADNAPPDWLPEMKDLLGGIFSHTGLPDGKAIAGTYTVRVADRSHPITRGLEDFTLKDELYSNLQMKDDVRPLATIDHDGTTWPVAWTYGYGRGKVFHTTLGHRSFGPDRDDPLRDPNLSRLVAQGIEWVAEQVGPSAGERAAPAPARSR